MYLNHNYFVTIRRGIENLIVVRNDWISGFKLQVVSRDDVCKTPVSLCLS